VERGRGSQPAGEDGVQPREARDVKAELARQERVAADIEKNKSYWIPAAEIVAFDVLLNRIDLYRKSCTVLQKLPGRFAMKTLWTELENYAGSELDADYD